MKVSVDHPLINARQSVALPLRGPCGGAVDRPALKATCRTLVAVCKELNLRGGEEVAIDGTFVNPLAGDARVVIKTRLASELKQIELDIDASYRGLDAQDA